MLLKLIVTAHAVVRIGGSNLPHIFQVALKGSFS